MNTRIAVAVLMIVATGLAPAESFQKSKLVDGKKEVPVQLTLDKQGQLMTLGNTNVPAISIPYASIDKLSYEKSAHHRIKEGAIVMIASLGAGSIVMLTKSKSHWLYVDYKETDGSAKNVTLRLDKSEYQNVLSTLQQQTGKEVETLGPQQKAEALK